MPRHLVSDMKVKIIKDTYISGREACAGGIEQVTEKEARDLIASGKAVLPTDADIKPSVAALREIFAGRPVALLGGGPSLPADLKKIKHLDPVLIGINHHAQLNGYACDIIVFFDSPARANLLAVAAEQAPIVVTSHGNYATHMLDVPYINHGMTAGLGVWLADYIGAESIWLCGMDCYTGTKTYFYNDEVPQGFDLAGQLECWKRITETTAAPVKAISGPLVDLFGRATVPRKKRISKK